MSHTHPPPPPSTPPATADQFTAATRTDHFMDEDVDDDDYNADLSACKAS
jgi:hypothetical protein